MRTGRPHDGPRHLLPPRAVAVLGDEGVTPTARTLAELRRRNWKAHGVVEQVVPRTFIKRDFLGVIDLIAVTPDGILGVQVTSGTNHAARRTKALAEQRLQLWLEAGGRFAIWSWSKRGAAGKRKQWALREEAITLAMFVEQTKEAV